MFFEKGINPLEVRASGKCCEHNLLVASVCISHGTER